LNGLLIKPFSTLNDKKEDEKVTEAEYDHPSFEDKDAIEVEFQDDLDVEVDYSSQGYGWNA